MAYKRKPKKKDYIAIQKIKADINDVVIIAKKDEIVSLTDNEALVLKDYIKEK